VNKAHARKTDPTTSHEAAASVGNITNTQKVILHLLQKPMTDVELIESFYKSVNRSLVWASESGIRSRRSELVQAGLVADSGTREKLPSGRNAIVWQAIQNA
jgi:hypothetical protein